ncbi:hypothetical protein N431DRAFT_429866, partial [Stipitochalara longipes BDJ]
MLTNSRQSTPHKSYADSFQFKCCRTPFKLTPTKHIPLLFVEVRTASRSLSLSLPSPSPSSTFLPHVSQTLTPSKIVSFPSLQVPFPCLVACKMPPNTVNGITSNTTTPTAIQINAFRRFQLLSLGDGSRDLRFAEREVR